MSKPSITCIANSDPAKGPEVPLYDCPCAECTAMEHDLVKSLGDTEVGLNRWRAETWPEYWQLDVHGRAFPVEVAK